MAAGEPHARASVWVRDRQEQERCGRPVRPILPTIFRTASTCLTIVSASRCPFCVRLIRGLQDYQVYATAQNLRIGCRNSHCSVGRMRVLRQVMMKLRFVQLKGIAMVNAGIFKKNVGTGGARPA